MKLFLTSTGLEPQVTEEFLKFLSKDPKETKLCFIATASEPEKDKWYVDKDIKRLKELGFKIVKLDLKKEKEESLRRKLSKVDVIYVEGGNTFYLLKWVRESGFDKVIVDILNKGKIYVGVSAGSILVGPNIELAGWKNFRENMIGDDNIVGLKNLIGLNLVPFAVFPHFQEKVHKELLTIETKQLNYPVIALSDQQAILVKDNEWKFVRK